MNENTKNAREGRERSNSRVFWWNAIGGTVLWLALMFLNAWNFGLGLSDDHKVWGEFGEYLGGILGPVFAFAAFLILLRTFQDQRLKIEEDRSYLEEERAGVLKRDFESTFFQLLHRFSEVVSDMQFASHSGREAIRLLSQHFAIKTQSNPQPPGVPTETYYEELYGIFYEEQQHVLGIYFRTLFHIFKFVDTSALTAAEKARYASIARAQLSAYELALIFYNGLWDEGRRGLRPLIQKYGILKHVRPGVLIHASDRHNPKLYEETAFLSYGKRLERWNGVEPRISYD